MVANAQVATPVNYTDETVRGFALAAVGWGVVGMLVGVIIAAQLAFPDLTYGISWLSSGRLRPLHTNAVIFAFGGCALMASSLYVVQRTSQVSLFAPKLAWFVACGWQVVIVAAAISLPMGYTRDNTLPSGMTLLGRAWTEATLFKLAYSYEQATRHRLAPASTPPLVRR